MKLSNLTVKKAGNWFHVWNLKLSKSVTKFESRSAAQSYITILEGC